MSTGQGINAGWDFQRRTSLNVATKAASATLIKQEAMYGLVIVTATATITLPSVTTDMKGAEVTIVARAATTVTADFGGVGTVSATLAAGDAGMFVCDGVYWYNCSVGTAA